MTFSALKITLIGILVTLGSLATATPPEPLDISKYSKEHRFEVSITGQISTTNESILRAYALIKTVDSDDLVMIHINSNGGDGDVMFKFIAKMKQSKAIYIAAIEGIAMSAAAVIAVQCDYIVSLPDTVWLFHMGTWHDGLKSWKPDWNTPEQTPALKLMEIAPLTDEEWYRMTRQKHDIYISGEEMNERLGNKAIVLGITVIPQDELRADPMNLLRNLLINMESIFISVKQFILEIPNIYESRPLQH